MSHSAFPLLYEGSQWIPRCSLQRSMETTTHLTLQELQALVLMVFGPSVHHL